MSTDNRCCGSNACIINDGECWYGQKWDGEKMCYPKPNTPEPDSKKINSDESSTK